MPIFSIIIVSYNTKQLLSELLKSIFTHCNSSHYEVIVVDNDSDDGSVAMLNSEFRDRIRLLENNKNLGFGAANNQGANVDKGEYLFFLNSDTRFKNDIFKDLADYLDSHRKVGIIAPRLVDNNKNNQPYAFGRFPTTMSAILDKLKSAPAYPVKPQTEDWVSGAAMIIRKNLFEKINGFDEGYFMYFEDIDLCRRVKASGYSIVVYPQAVIMHWGGKSIGKFRQRKLYYYRSQNYYFKKYQGWPGYWVMRIIRWPRKLISLIFNE